MFESDHRFIVAGTAKPDWNLGQYALTEQAAREKAAEYQGQEGEKEMSSVAIVDRLTSKVEVLKGDVARVVAYCQEKFAEALRGNLEAGKIG